jgi:hypothetical protein
MESKAIWHPQAPARVYLRRAVDLSSPMAAGWLECAISGFGFEVSLDGMVIGRGFGSGTAAGTPSWVRFNLPRELATGRHELIVLADGGSTNSTQPAWFRCRGEVGTEMEIVSDASWGAVALAEASLAAGGLELHDAGDDPRFQSEGEDDYLWDEVCLLDVDEALVRPVNKTAATEIINIHPTGIVSFGEATPHESLSFFPELEMSICKCVHPDGLLGADKGRTIVQTRSRDRAVVIIVDFGRVVSGRPLLRLRSEARGGTIDLGYSCERSAVQTRARYVCRSGAQEWTGLRLQRGRFLILRLSDFAVEVELERVELLLSRTAVSTTGTLSEPEDLQQIWQTGQRSLGLCRHESYAVGPPEQPFEWNRAFALSLNDYYLTGDCRTARATLHSQMRVDGSDSGSALFIDAYHSYSGDTEVVESAAPALQRLLEEAPREHSGTTADLAWRAGCLQALVRLFGMLGDTPGAANGERQIDSIKAMLEAAWSEEKGLYADVLDEHGPSSFSQWTNGLILYFGLADTSRHEQVVGALRSADVEPVVDYLQAYFLLGGLWHANAEERALEFTRNWWGRVVGRDGISWSDKVGAGNIQGLEAPGPEYYLGSHLLGVRPASPGWNVMEIRPPAQVVGRVRGHLMTGRGRVDVEWHRHDVTATMTLKFSAEQGGETHLRLARRTRFPYVELNGEAVWRNEKMIPNSNTRLVMAEDDHITLVVHESGPYEIRIE